MKSVVVLLTFMLALVSYGQSIKVYGKVEDKEAGPIPGATVMLIGQQDSILKSFAVTDKEGNFVVQNVKPGNYIFKANFYGYQPHELAFSITESSKDTALSKIELMPKMLNAVTVQADYIPIQIKGDTIEYDSRAFETGEHDVVENLLEQLPGVEVQPDGSIKVQGKTVEKILVDGEEFFGNDPTIATKNLPAEAVDKVQVFEKDSDMSTFTGVEDGDEATTINLTLKEDHKKGYFGNAELAYGGGESLWSEPNGDQNRYKAKGNVHYFKDKWQVSGIGLSNNINETGFSIDDYISFMGGIQNLASGGSMSLSFDSDNDQGLPLDFGQNNGYLNTNALGFNVNYKPSKKANVSSSVFFNTFDKTFDRSIDRTTYFQDSSLFSQEEILQNSLSYNNRGNMHYKQEFDSTHFLNVDFSGNWTSSDYSNTNRLLNFDSGSALRNTYATNINQDEFRYKATLAADYRKKFAKKGRYTGGGLSYGVNNQNSATLLKYVNTLYLTEPVLTNIEQAQDDDRMNTTFGANWMFSEAITKRQLIQVEIGHRRNEFGREKVVNDDTEAGPIYNPFLSGKATYLTTVNEAELRHKFLKKKFKTTAGLTFNQLSMLSTELFDATRTYNYALPFFKLNWEVSKSSDIRLDYTTSVNAPSLLQLQAIPNNTNPAEISLGNTNLNPEYIHRAGVEFDYFNEFNFMHLMARLDASRTLNKINYSQSVDANFNRTFLPENNGYEDQLMSYITFGTNLSPLKTKFSISNTSQVSQGQLKLNGVQNQYTSYFTNTRFTVENTKKKVINIRTGVEANYSTNVYSENEAFNSDVFSWNYWGSITLKLKDKWVLNTNAKHQLFPSFASNNEQVIINAMVARNLLKSKKLQVYLSANDILNQNTGINQSYFLNYYEQERTATLARYFMLGVKYSFQKLGAK